MVIAQRVSTLTYCIRTAPTVAVVVVAVAGRHIGYRTCQMNECDESHQNVSVLGIDGPMLIDGQWLANIRRSDCSVWMVAFLPCPLVKVTIMYVVKCLSERLCQNLIR